MGNFNAQGGLRNKGVLLSSSCPTTQKRGNFLVVGTASLLVSLVTVFIAISGRISPSFAIAAAVYTAMVYIAIFVRTSAGRIDVLNPHLVFIAIYSVYAWSGAILAEFFGGATYTGANVSFEAQELYYLSINIGLAGFIVGYRYFRYSFAPLVRRISQFQTQISERHFVSVVLLAAIIVTLFNLSITLNWFDIGSATIYSEVATQKRVDAGEAASYGINEFFSGMSIRLILCVMLLCLGKNRFWNIGIIAFLIMGTLPSLARGERWVLLFVAIALLLTYHYRIRRLRWWQVMIPAIMVYILLGTIQHVRYTNDLKEMFVGATKLLGDDPSYLLPIRVGEFAAPSGSFLILIDSIFQGFAKFNWGYSYLTELAVWIPRPLFPGRPLPLPELFMSTHFPVLYSTGHGFGFFMLMEGYWAFGIPGVFLDMVMFGMLIAIAHRFLEDASNSKVGLLFYILIFPGLVITSSRTGMFGSIKYSILTCAPIVALMILSRILQSGGKNIRPRSLG
jgi:oligosaccharide repeat unit polymerase